MDWRTIDNVLNCWIASFLLPEQIVLTRFAKSIPIMYYNRLNKVGFDSLCQLLQDGTFIIVPNVHCCIQYTSPILSYACLHTLHLRHHHCSNTWALAFCEELECLKREMDLVDAELVDSLPVDVSTLPEPNLNQLDSNEPPPRRRRTPTPVVQQRRTMNTILIPSVSISYLFCNRVHICT